MKKLLLLFLLPLYTFAQNGDAQKQDIENPYTISVFGAYSEPGQFGASFEWFWSGENGKDAAHKRSTIVNVSMGALTLESDVVDDITGSGIVVDLGGRTYWKKNSYEGIYTENFLTYGNIKFDDDNLNGTYSYWSLINPNVGYKIALGDFCIDPFLGFNWKWEVKGKGDVDNKEFDNLVWRAGLKIGYRF